MLLNYLPVVLFAVFILYEIKISGNKAAFYFFLILYIIVFAIIIPYLTLSPQQSFDLENIIGKKEILNNQIWFMIFFSIPVFLKVRKNVETTLPNIDEEKKHNTTLNLTFYHIIYVGLLSYFSYSLFYSKIYPLAEKIIKSNIIAVILPFLLMQSLYFFADRITPYLNKCIKPYIPKKTILATDLQEVKTEDLYRDLAINNIFNPLISAAVYLSILFLVYLFIFLTFPI